MITISLNITPPPGMTDAEALRLFTAFHGYNPDVSGTRAAFAKQRIIAPVRQAIMAQRDIEAKAAIVIPDDVTVN